MHGAAISWSRCAAAWAREEYPYKRREVDGENTCTVEEDGTDAGCILAAAVWRIGRCRCW